LQSAVGVGTRRAVGHHALHPPEDIPKAGSPRLARLAALPPHSKVAARNLLNDLGGVGAFHGRTQGEDRRQDRAQRVEVAARIQRLDFAARLLGAHVLRRAEDRARLGALAGPRIKHRGPGLEGVWVRRRGGAVAHRAPRAVWNRRPTIFPRTAFRVPHFLGQPPIHHQHLAEVAEHDVLGLEIAMDHSARVRGGHGVAHFLKGREQRGEGEVVSRQWTVFSPAAVTFPITDH